VFSLPDLYQPTGIVKGVPLVSGHGYAAPGPFTTNEVEVDFSLHGGPRLDAAVLVDMYSITGT
jgi:hypothetical protein